VSSQLYKVYIIASCFGGIRNNIKTYKISKQYEFVIMAHYLGLELGPTGSLFHDVQSLTELILLTGYIDME